MNDSASTSFGNAQEKEVFVQGVFSNIAKHYDLMNTILSFHRDA